MINTLFIGKDLPDSLEFAEALSNNGRKILGITRTEADAVNLSTENILCTTWNKASAISAHSLIIKAETNFENLDEVIFYFDASYFCSKFELDKSEEISNAVDTMINSYLYATSELLKRIDQKKDSITVCFLLKENPSKLDILTSKNGVSIPASNIVSAAQAAFASLAESFSTNVSDRNYLTVLLAKYNNSNEFFKNEKLTADWMCSSLSSLKEMKNHQNIKNASTWNKVGVKVSTGFSLFK